MKRLLKFLTRCGVALTAAGVLLSMTGCATVEKYSLTYRVWETSDMRQFNEPAPDPKLALFRPLDDHDVLVQYDACSEKHSAVKRRAYYLRLNQTRVVEGRKPEFVNPSQAEGMATIPVLNPDSGSTNAPSNVTDYAVTSRDGAQFTLYSSTGGSAIHDLPVYAETSGMARRVALTPFAVAGDTLMVAGVAAVVAVSALAESGTSFTIH